jgi:hypothetical protein
MVIAGLSQSAASGLNTWLIRRVFGSKGVTIGSERIRPWLLAGWAATYAFALWDAWVGAASSRDPGRAVGHAESRPLTRE